MLLNSNTRHCFPFSYVIYVTNLSYAAKFFEQYFPKMKTQACYRCFHVHWPQQLSVKQNPIIVSNASIPSTKIKQLSVTKGVSNPFTQGCYLRFRVYCTSTKQNPVIVSNTSIAASIIKQLSAIGCQFYPFFTQRYIIIRQRYSLNFVKISHKLVDIFGIKWAKSTGSSKIRYAGLGKINSDLHHFSPGNSIPLRHYLCKFLFLYLNWCLSYIL